MQDTRDVWFIDSGCSRHMTGNLTLLENIQPIEGPLVTFGDNEKKGRTKAVGEIHNNELVIKICDTL